MNTTKKRFLILSLATLFIVAPFGTIKTKAATAQEINATSLMVQAKNGDYSKLKAAYDAVYALPTQWKTTRYNLIQAYNKIAININNQAAASVRKVRTTKDKKDINASVKLVNYFPNGNAKTTLQKLISQMTLEYFPDGSNNSNEDISLSLDKDGNDDIINASIINIGENVTGNIDQNNDTTDIYKLIVAKDCTLNIKLYQNENKNITLYIYGKDGDNNDPISYDRWDSKSVRNINEGLSAGTYYIKVNSENSGTYKMSLDYEVESKPNDAENNDMYIKGKNLQLNTNTNGHIGNLTDSSSRDTVDFYTFTITKDGTINFKLSHDLGKNIQIYLYGKDGDNNESIADGGWDSKSVRNITEGLQVGTYYVKVYSEGYGTYTLNTTFHEDEVINDLGANDVYINPIDINLYDTLTGHIGYLKDDNSRDTADWYKIVLNSDTNISIDLSNSVGKNINLYLYGEDGDNDYYISADYGWEYKSVRNINEFLTKGTYLIKVGADDNSGYKLSVQPNQ